MNVLNIMQGTNLGGTERSSLELMRALKLRNFKFHVLSLNTIGPLKEEMDVNNISYIGFKYQGFWGMPNLFKYRKSIKEFNPDIIFLTGISFVGMISSLFLAKKKFLFVHYHHLGVKHLIIWKLIYFISYKVFDKIFFVSKFIYDEAKAIYPKLKKKSFILPNPLKKRELVKTEDKLMARKSIGLSSKDIVIGNAGWLIRRKRFDVFLRVCAKVCHAHQNVKILIAGDGEERSNLIALSKELGIHDKVIWMGWVTDMNLFYSSIDLLLFNSDVDAVGLSPLESIQRGIVTFASVKRGGLREILSNEFSQFIIYSHDVEILANRIDSFIQNNSKFKKETLRCRDYVNAISDPEKIAANFMYFTKLTS